MKKMNQPRKLYTVDEQGHIKFGLRPALARESGKPDSGWEHPVASIIIMCVCGVLDFIMFKQLFSSFLYDSVLVQMLSIIAMLIGFDLAPIYLGVVLKKQTQGFRVEKVVMGLFALAFMIAFICNLALRIAVRDLVLPDLSAMTVSIFGEAEETSTGNSLALLYALFASAMPVITSLVSFGVSFQSSDPLKSRIKALQEQIVAEENEVMEIEALLMEYESDPDHMERLLAEDGEKYQAMLDMIDEQTHWYCDYVRERIKEYLGDPASCNVLSRDIREELEVLLGDAA